jgi:23S rRNA (guanosine2251-2'-O)-methyltransferase
MKRFTSVEGEPEAPRLVVGLQPVREAVRAHGARLGRLLLVDRPGDAAGRLAALERFARDQGVGEILRVPRSDLDRVAGAARHQGTIAWAPELELVDPAVLLGRSALLAVALDGIQDPQNFGAVVRSAVGVAGAAVVFPEHGAAPLTVSTFRASAGAIEHATLCRVPSLADFLESAALGGATIVGLDPQADRELRDLELAAPTVLAIGSEDRGLHRAVRRACTTTARLVAARGVDSLNASVAAAIALYEVANKLKNTIISR